MLGDIGLSASAPQTTMPSPDAQAVAYDAKGNLISDGHWTFSYDAENRLISATEGAATITYGYDPLGHRARRTIGSVSTYFLGDAQDEEIAEYTATGSLTYRFVPEPAIDQPIAQVTAAGVISYFHKDRLGSVIAMSGTGGNVTEGPYRYDAYGNGAPTTGSPFKYTGRRLDPETGLYYYRARYYSTRIGRFLQVDPIGYGDDYNLYMYSRNQPTNLMDPTGLFPFGGDESKDFATDSIDQEVSAESMVSKTIEKTPGALADAAADAADATKSAAVEVGTTIAKEGPGVVATVAGMTPAGRGVQAIAVGAAIVDDVIKESSSAAANAAGAIGADNFMEKKGIPKAGAAGVLRWTVGQVSGLASGDMVEEYEDDRKNEK